MGYYVRQTLLRVRKRFEIAKNTYQKGSTYHVYVQKKDFTCKAVSSLRRFAIVYLFSTYLFGVVVSCWILVCVGNLCKSQLGEK